MASTIRANSAISTRSSCSRRLGSSSLPRSALKRGVVTRAVVNITPETFEEEVLKADGAVLVDFWANWCGPCRLVHPLMDWADKEYADLKVVKVETDKNKPLVEQYKVYGLPTLIVFKDGKEVDGSKREGAITKQLLAQYLKEFASAKVLAQ